MRTKRAESFTFHVQITPNWLILDLNRQKEMVFWKTSWGGGQNNLFSPMPPLPLAPPLVLIKTYIINLMIYVLIKHRICLYLHSFQQQFRKKKCQWS